MVSDFRRKKLVRGFEFFDTDKSGSVERADFELAAQKIKEKNGWSDDEPKFQKLTAFMLNMWEGIQKEADTDNDGKVTLEEWIQVWDNFSKNPKPADWQVKSAQFTFNIFDRAGAGKLTADSYVAVVTSFGRSKEDAEAAFKKISKGKSEIVFDDFFALYKEYNAADNLDAPGNAIFGRVNWD